LAATTPAGSSGVVSRPAAQCSAPYCPSTSRPGHRVEAAEPDDHLGRPAGDHGERADPAGEPAQRLDRTGRRHRLVRVVDDRRSTPS
jgi:hypothetical protein